MDVKTIVYGETAIDSLVQWLKATGEPQDLDVLLEQYLEMLRELVLEEQQ
jgi:hypothetical protein